LRQAVTLSRFRRETFATLAAYLLSIGHYRPSNGRQDMNRIKTAFVAALGMAAVAAPAVASAAPWQSINQRQARIETRIDQGVRSGSLNRNEAVRLRAQFRQLANLENRYRRSNGLSNWERQDLNRRFDQLSARVFNQKHDRQHRW
jgi:hypothetical protein